MTTCELPGCDRKHWGRGLCQAHYTRWLRTGSVELERPVQTHQSQGPVCSVDSCFRTPHARGLCRGHHQRFIAHGEVDPGRPLIQRHRVGCAVETCAGKHYAGGFCRLHWRRLRNTGTTDAAEYVRPMCSVPGCGRPARSHGWCGTHHERWRRTGSIRSEKPVLLRGGTCDLPGCDRPHYSLRYCLGHYCKFVHVPRRRSLEHNAQGSASPEQVEARLAYFGYRCWICGGPYQEIDHVKPLSKGGPNWASNLRPTCKSCNCRKHNRWYGVARLQEVA